METTYAAWFLRICYAGETDQAHRRLGWQRPNLDAALGIGGNRSSLPPAASHLTACRIGPLLFVRFAKFHLSVSVI